MIIRNWLKKMRFEKGLSTYNIAKILKISQASYTSYENGRRNPSVKTAQKIAAYFGFDWTLFFEKDDNKKSTA